MVTELPPMPACPRAAIARLNAAGYEAFAVGGCVRDALLGLSPKDWDIATMALPREVETVFADCRVVETGLRHGTVTVFFDGQPLEITTYRVDGAYADGRHPDGVIFTPSLSEDLKRRDFTVNAMAWHPESGLFDPFDGKNDLRNGVLRCVGEAACRFHEDALRILRALRFAAELGFDIAPDTACAMRELSGRLTLISRERIAAELLRALNGINAVPVLQAFDTVLLAALPDYPAAALPEALHALAILPRGDTVLRLAALLSPCGEAGARALASLKPSRALYSQVLALTAAAGEDISRAELPLWLARLGETQLRRLLTLQGRDDLLSCLPALLAQHPPLTLGELQINGRDLTAAGLPAGAELGRTLNALHRRVLLGELSNERGALLAAATKMKT